MEKNNNYDMEEKTKILYDAIVHFDESRDARDKYYDIMDSVTGRTMPDGSEETVRDQILKAYAMLFCENAKIGQPADVDDVADMADRLYIGSTGYDPEHWYRMKYHFPVIDEDNYDRFAALVLSDMRVGFLYDLAEREGETLVIGEPDPLHMTMEKRQNQKVVSVGTLGGSDI